MKRCLFLISTIFLFSFVAIAQINSENSTEWQILSPENEEFSVDAPENIEVFSYDEKCINNKYSGKSEGTYIFIFSNDLKSGFDETPMKFIEVSQKAELEKQVNQNEMKFVFSDDEDFFHTIYTKKTKTRTYLFHLISEKKADPNVPRFFKSLKINEKSSDTEIEQVSSEKISEVDNTKPTEILNQNKDFENTVSGTSEGRGKGNNAGYGTGKGEGSGSGIVPPKTENRVFDVRALNITFKPKPKYTDLARSYGIVGNIRVKTTFLKDGTIGEVIPSSKLPFGLTKSALQAAKQIRFDPKIENQKPVTVTKVLVFNFTIY